MTIIDVQFARKVAEEFGYNEIPLRELEQRYMISFYQTSTNTRINVYFTTGTVGSCLDHPRQGKTQVFGRNMTNDDLRQILKNPHAILQ